MAEKPLATFTQWLARMTTNESSIGTFARETAQDPTWPKEGQTRGRFLGYLIDTHAPDIRVKAFSRAWASYEQAIRRATRLAQGGQIAGRVVYYTSGEQDAQERAQDVQDEPGVQETAQGEQDAQGEQETAQAYDKNHAYASALHVLTLPIDAPCQECGGGLDTMQWTLPGIGTGVLCRKCLNIVLAQINTALGQNRG